MASSSNSKTPKVTDSIAKANLNIDAILQLNSNNGYEEDPRKRRVESTQQSHVSSIDEVIKQ